MSYNPTFIWNRLNTVLPELAKEVKEFKTQNNGMSILLLFEGRKALLFTLLPNNRWRLETNK